MNILIGLSAVLFVFPAHGQDDYCQTNKNGFEICKKSTNTITRVTDQHQSHGRREKRLVIEVDGDTTIDPNAFNLPRLVSLRFEFPYESVRNQSALPTLTLHPDSFAGLKNIYSIFIMHANVQLLEASLTPNTHLQWLRFMYCGFSEVPTKMLESTPNLDQLSFENNYLRTIRPNAFAPLAKLRELHLERNGIVSLALGCFNGLDNLEVLNVADNDFTAVSGIFHGLSKLIRLDINDAFGDGGFNVDILRDLPALLNIRMGENGISSLQPNMFDVVPDVQFLSLFGNEIPRVPKGVFDKLTSLKLVHLAQNDITTIEPGAFSGLSMNYLYLLDNEGDKVIETGTFSNLSVIGLILENSSIRELKPGAFDGLSAKQLDLSRNKLAEIGGQDFVGLYVEELDLSDNKIVQIATNAFNNMTVHQVKLGGNPIDITGRDNWGLPKSVKILI